ncbi:hypothetical protein G6F65_017068 [Rhizopus arrhizus]|nr:hypothetical protein G6F65_017068 [Rhizopus arrhizus]
MMMLWPSVLAMEAPRLRATTSVGPPAANGTTSEMGWFGYAPCALAEPQARQDRASMGQAARVAARAKIGGMSRSLWFSRTRERIADHSQCGASCQG